MAHVVFVAHGLTSPLNASLELSRRLAAAGHQVTYVSHADIGAEVEAGGFAFVQLTNAQELRRTLRQAIRHPIHWAGSMRRERSRSIKSDELERAIDALAPDLLLIDIEMHYVIIATAALGVPTMLVMNWLSIFRVAGLPPLSSSLLPGDEKAIRRAWLKVRVRALGARVAHKLGRGALGDLLRPVSYGTRFYADLKQVARHRNYPLRTNTDRSQWLRPYMYTQLPVLCFNAYELEFPHRPHPNIRYVGPMVNKQRTERRVSNHDRQRWASFKQHRRGDRPLIYCSLGSYWSDRDFLQMVLRVFSDRPEWDLVLGDHFLRLQTRSVRFRITSCSSIMRPNSRCSPRPMAPSTTEESPRSTNASHTECRPSSTHRACSIKKVAPPASPTTTSGCGQPGRSSIRQPWSKFARMKSNC